MTAIDYARLRELAEKATPGPWFAENYATDPHDRTVVYNTFHNGDTMDRDLVAEVAYGNAEFIAAADPQTVLALLDEIEGLRSALFRILGYTRGAVRRLMPEELAELERERRSDD